METDVVVVGGGPAGLVAARTVAASGFDVVVVERQASIAETVRTSGATAPVTVARFGIPDELVHRLPRLRISSPGATARFECGDDGLCVLDVRGTYRWLAAEAVRDQATILTGAVARRPVVDGTTVAGCVVQRGGEEETIRARVLVDAGGHRAHMSKRAGLHPGFTRFGVGAEYELVAPRVDQEELVLILSSRHAPSGYAWAFPWGRQRVRLGVGVHHADVRTNPRGHAEDLYRDGASFGLDLAGATTVEVHDGLIPADPLANRFTADGIVAVGDAAGQATLVVGEGIRMSMIAGELAGETIAAALRRGRTDAAALRPYEQRFRAEFERGLRAGYALNRRLAAYVDRQWDERLQLLETMPPRLVLSLLQSQPRASDLIPWALGHPRQWLRAGSLARVLWGG